LGYLLISQWTDTIFLLSINALTPNRVFSHQLIRRGVHRRPEAMPALGMAFSSQPRGKKAPAGKRNVATQRNWTSPFGRSILNAARFSYQAPDVAGQQCDSVLAGHLRVGPHSAFCCINRPVSALRFVKCFLPKRRLGQETTPQDDGLKSIQFD
jgi:hypothetical protein